MKSQAQKNKIIKELNEKISLRNHVFTLVNGPRTSLISKEEERKLRLFANQLDREVVDKSLELVILSEEETQEDTNSKQVPLDLKEKSKT